MHPIVVIVPLILFVLLVWAFLLVLRRAAGVVAETREIEAFRRATADLAARIDESLGGVADRIDAVRRRKIAPDEIRENLDAAADAVRRYGEETASLHAPGGLEPLREAIADELGRAGRALEMVGHGCTLLALETARPRELEGQTAVKRGYLNILHARDAIMRAAADAALPGAHAGRRWFSERPPG